MSPNPLKRLAPQSRERSELPKLGELNGQKVIVCPFCDPPHALIAEEVAPCGTYIQVRAVQNVFRNEKCELCGERNGLLIMVGNKFKHTHDCSPGKFLFAAPPKKSTIAGVVYKLPDFIQPAFAKIFKRTPIQLSVNGKPEGFAWKNMQV